MRTTKRSTLRDRIPILEEVFGEACEHRNSPWCRRYNCLVERIKRKDEGRWDEQVREIFRSGIVPWEWLPGKLKRRYPSIRFDRQRKVSLDQQTAVLRRDDNQCRYCGLHVNDSSANIDHVLAWSRGGQTTMDNLVASCWNCNKEKYNRGGFTPGKFVGNDPFDSRFHPSPAQAAEYRDMMQHLESI